MRSKLRPHPFHGEREARSQLERWKPEELVHSRRMIAKEYASRPWILSLYRGLLPSRGRDRVGSMLDVGCGTGFFTRFVADRVVAPLESPATVVGVDLNRSLLEAARKQRSDGGVEPEYVQASAYCLPFRAGSFDLVTCRTVLMHLSSPADALREMRAAARVGGRVACEEPDYGMTGSFDPGFAEEERRVSEARVLGLSRMYGQDYRMGRRLPELLHGAGLGQIMLEGMFHGLIVPCDPRIKAASLESRLAAELSYYSQRVHLDEFRKTLRAGGLSSEEIDGGLEVWRKRTRRRIGALRRSSRAKEGDTSFLAVPFFLAVGRRPADKRAPRRGSR
ncbi:MAG: methyltransferase domain-containing protein [Nitrososphaerales archaeon]|jgi:2-polyprenyl-3-methyl-5-hydroxy-6-metoxy-1,4-benzoquinol methylase